MSFIKKRVRSNRLVPLAIRFTAMLLLVCLALPLIASDSSSAFTPITRPLRIGLRWSTTEPNPAPTSLTLTNTSGFRVGHYTGANSTFTQIGTTTTGTPHRSSGSSLPDVPLSTCSLRRTRRMTEPSLR